MQTNTYFMEIMSYFCTYFMFMICYLHTVLHKCNMDKNEKVCFHKHIVRTLNTPSYLFRESSFVLMGLDTFSFPRSDFVASQ